VISDGTKRTISFGAFGFGIFGGLWGRLAFARSAFTIGGNDNWQEIWAMTFAFATPLPACILALWKRVIAGWWLVFVGCFLPYGMLCQRAYMIQVRGSTDEHPILRTVLICLIISGPLIAIGLFGILTGHWNWPKLLVSRPSNENDRPVSGRF